MEAVAETSVVHNIVKEVVDLGVGLISLYKVYRSQLRQGVDDAQRGASQLQDEAAQVQPDVKRLRKDLKEIEQSNPKVFDNQASLLALFSEGPVQICSGKLDALQCEINKGFDSVIQTAKDSDAIRDAREFKTKLNTAAIACNCMLDDIVVAAESQQKCISDGTRTDILKAEQSATYLYEWAKPFVSNSPGAMTKRSKLKTMPYIVAMAYATRIQLITQILQHDMTEQEYDKITYQKRARSAVNEFTAMLTTTLEGVMANTSLLEVAMDYQLPIAMYLTLMASFHNSVEELLAPGAEHKEIVVWDDELSPIRDALRLHTDAAADQGQGHTIELSVAKDSIWWATFTDTDLETIHTLQLRISIGVRELCHVLGATDDESIDNFMLEPGQKSTLTQLPPASAMRAALCAKISQVLKAVHSAPSPPPPPLPRSFARVNAPPLVDSPHTAVAHRTLCGHTSDVFGVAVCADGERVVSGSWDGTVRVWSLSSGKELRTFSGHADQANCVAVSPDGKCAVSLHADKSVSVLSLESGSTQPTVLQGHSGPVLGVAISPDGRRIASGSRDRIINFWDARDGRSQAQLEAHSDAVRSLAFTPDGSRLISGGDDKSIRVWNVRERALERTLHGHTDAVRGVAVTPDGRRLISGSGDMTVRVWNLSSGKEEMRFEEHTDAVSCVAASSDGERIVSGSSDCTVRVWNLRRQELELTLRGHASQVRCVAVSPDGESVVSGGEDNKIKVWPLQRCEMGAIDGPRRGYAAGERRRSRVRAGRRPWFVPNCKRLLWVGLGAAALFGGPGMLRRLRDAQADADDAERDGK